VRRSKDGGTENYFEAALDALDLVFDYIGWDSFEYAVVFVWKHFSENWIVRIGDCGGRCEQEEKTHDGNGEAASGISEGSRSAARGVRRKLGCGGGTAG
jgi:hypothetical protein